MGSPFKLRNGTLLLSTEAPGGIYNSAQLKKIAELCDGDTAIVKATEDQRLALFVTEDKMQKTAEALKAIGLTVRNYQDGLHQPTACIGELCPDHEQDALGAAIEISNELASVTLEQSLKVGVNGCFRCCVPCHTLDISVMGEANGYRISIGGKNSQIPEIAAFVAEGVPAAELPKLIHKIVEVYKQNAQPGETLQEVMERCGVSSFVQALAPYSQDAAAAEVNFADPTPEEPLLMTDDEILDVPQGMTDDARTSQITESEMLAEPEIIEDEEIEVADGMDANPMLNGNPDGALSDDLTPGDVLGDRSHGPDINPREFTASHGLKGDVPIKENSFDEEDEFLADELGEEVEEELEQKLNESIAEEQDFVPLQDDGISHERLSTLGLVESGEVGAADESESFADGEASADVFTADESFDYAPTQISGKNKKSSSNGSGWQLAGIAPMGETQVAINFAAGAQIIIDVTKLVANQESRRLKIGDQEVFLSRSQKGVKVEVDGLIVLLPLKAA